MKPFYLVWNPATEQTNHKYETKDLAIKEAQRLASNNPGQAFIVLQPVSISRKVNIETREYDYSGRADIEDEIPF